jgi:hypothetical protein
MVHDGSKGRIPRYYRRCLERDHPGLAEVVAERLEEYQAKVPAVDWVRLRAAEVIHIRRNELARQRKF